MARRPAPLQTSQRQVGISARTADTPAFVPANSSVGFSRAASSLLQMSEGFAREAATEAQVAGEKAAVSQKLSVDKAGTPRPLDRPEGGGQFYNDAFNKVADKRYGDALINSTSAQLAELALDPELIANPDAYSQAAEKIASTMAMSMPEDYSLAGLVLDGIASARVQNEAKIRVNAFNLEMKQGEDQYKTEFEAATQEIYDLYASGQSLPQERIDALNTMTQDASAFGVQFNLQKTIDIGKKVYAPVRNLRKSLGPVGLQSTAANLQNGDTTGTGIDSATWARLPTSQRNQITSALRAEAVAKNARAAAAAASAAGAPTSASAIARDSKLKKKLRDTFDHRVIAQNNWIPQGYIQALVTRSNDDTLDAEPFLRAMSQLAEVRGDTSNLSDLTSNELNQFRFLQTMGFTKRSLNIMRVAELKAQDNEELSFSAWSKKNKENIDDILEGKRSGSLIPFFGSGESAYEGLFGGQTFSESDAELFEAYRQNMLRSVWYNMIGGPDSAQSLEQEMINQRDRLTSEYSVPNLSAAGQRFIDGAGGAKAIRDNLIVRLNELSGQQGREQDSQELLEKGIIRLGISDRPNSRGEIDIFLEYRPTLGTRSGVFTRITDSLSIQQYNKLVPPSVSAEEEQAAHDLAVELVGMVESDSSDEKIGKAILAEMVAGNESDPTEVGRFFKQFNSEPLETWQDRNEDDMSTPEKIAYAISKTTREDNEIDVSATLLPSVIPDNSNIVKLTQTNNRYAGYNSRDNKYTISSPDSKEGSWVSLKPAQAQRKLKSVERALKGNLSTEQKSVLKREQSELTIVVQHFRNGGDLIEQDNLLKIAVEGLARSPSARDIHAKDILLPEYRVSFDDLIKMKAISPGRMSTGEQTETELYYYYLRKELAYRGVANNAARRLEELGNPPIPQAAIDFVARIKANTDG